MSTPSINSFGTAEPESSDDDQPVTMGQLKFILSEFKESVERALAGQDADFEERFGSGFGLLEPGDDPNDADTFSAVERVSASVPGGSVLDRYRGERTVKSTVLIPEKLHTALKQYGIEGSEPGETGPGLKLQTQLIIAIEEYLAKRGR